MSLAFVGPGGTVEQRWIFYALLRDNVQHHLENGKPSAEFSALHSVAKALAEGRVRIPARKLHAELLRAREALVDKPAAELAISSRTQGALHLQTPRREKAKSPDTLLLGSPAFIPSLQVQDAATLGDVFGPFLDRLISITDGASEGALVDVIDS